MAGVRSMLSRVQRLEQARAPTTPFERAFGSLDAWEANCQAGIDEGRLDPIDMPQIMTFVRSWHRDGLSLRLR